MMLISLIFTDINFTDAHLDDTNVIGAALTGINLRMLKFLTLIYTVVSYLVSFIKDSNILKNYYLYTVCLKLFLYLEY